MQYYVLKTKKMFETDPNGYETLLYTSMDRSPVKITETIEAARNEMRALESFVVSSLEKSHDRVYKLKDDMNEIIIRAETNALNGAIMTDFIKFEIGWL